MTRTTPGALAFEDLDEFFDEGEFATAVVLSTGVRFQGLYQATSADGGELGGPEVIVRQRDVDTHSVSAGTTVTIDGETRVVAAVRPDGYGVARLVLDAQ